MGDVKPVRMRPIASHQQPACQPCFDHMETLAGGGLGQLHQRDIQVAIQRTAQHGADRELIEKLSRFDPPRPACALHQPTLRCEVHAQHQRDAQHALVADQSHFDLVVVSRRGNQHHEAVEGEKYMTDGLAWFAQDGCEPEIHLLTARQKGVPGRRWQCAEKAILRGAMCRRGCAHSTLCGRDSGTSVCWPA